MKIDKGHIAVLRVIEGLGRRYKHVPIDVITSKLPMSPKRSRFLISELNKMGYLTFFTHRDTGVAVKIADTGFDVLSLWDFKKHGVITNIGSVVGTGKESDIISAETKNGFAAVKMNRYNQKEFIKIKKSLSWTAVKRVIENLGIKDYEVNVPRAKAQTEFKVLTDLHGVIPVPEPYAINRHAVCMQFIGNKSLPAKTLAKVVLKEPADVLDLIIEDYEKAAKKWVHGDFSEFNIMITDDGELYYIDWPQAVPADYKNADQMKERDLANIKNYFKNKYGL